MNMHVSITMTTAPEEGDRSLADVLKDAIALLEGEVEKAVAQNMKVSFSGTVHVSMGFPPPSV